MSIEGTPVEIKGISTPASKKDTDAQNLSTDPQNSGGQATPDTAFDTSQELSDLTIENIKVGQAIWDASGDWPVSYEVIRIFEDRVYVKERLSEKPGHVKSEPCSIPAWTLFSFHGSREAALRGFIKRQRAMRQHIDAVIEKADTELTDLCLAKARGGSNG